MCYSLNVIDKSNLKNHLQELDEQLVLLGEAKSRELIIYGGAALISMDIISRATVDIDVFSPHLDAVIVKAIKTIAEKHLYDENWINSTGSAFSYELPQGWRERSIVFFKGKVLTVKTLSRIDLIFTKFLAELDRGEDLEDLKSLKPTKNDLEKIKSALINLESNQAWSQKIDEIVELLLESKND